MKWILRINSAHGSKATVPFLKSVEVQWENRNCKYVYSVLFMYTYIFFCCSATKVLLVILRILTRFSPFFIAFQVSFPDRPDMKCALMQKQPFVLKRYLEFKSLNLQVNHSFIIFLFWEKYQYRETVQRKPFKILLTLNLSDGCGCSFSQIEWPVNFQATNSIYIHL